MNIKNSNVNFQNFRISDYNKHWSYSNFFRNMYICSELFEGQTIIDLGCGDSMYEHYAQKNFGRNISIRKYDHNPEMNANVIKLDITTGLHEQNNTVDVVIFAEVIEHIERKYHSFIMREIKRVLKPNGKLILSTPTPNKPEQEFVWPDDHEFEYSTQELIDFVEAEDFRIIRAMPWSIDKSVLERFDSANDIPDPLKRALVGLMVPIHEARQLILTCTQFI